MKFLVKYLAFLILLLAFDVFVKPVFCQGNKVVVEQDTGLLANFEKLLVDTCQHNAMLRENLGMNQLELMKAGAESELNYHIKYYSYYGDSLEHRKRMFAWQYHSQIAIFILVIIIVLTGLLFSWLQFRKSIGRNIPISQTDNNPELSVTNLELSLQKIKISSSFIGLVILVISLAFFYLYLVHIYPIEEISSPVVKP